MKNSAIIIIGNEILSGRTLDVNTQYIASKLEILGINLIEVRVIADDENLIISCVQELSSKYDYIFTTGGIGPTHDDITTESIAKAFNVPCVIRQEVYDLLSNAYQSRGEQMNPAREKMAHFPEGATLIKNNVSLAPGFRIKNVFVMAGIPNIMQSMFDNAVQLLETSLPIITKSMDLMIGESIIAETFLELQKAYPSISMGSYPFKKEESHGTSLVLRSNNSELLEEAFTKLHKAMSKFCTPKL